MEGVRRSLRFSPAQARQPHSSGGLVSPEINARLVLAGFFFALNLMPDNDHDIRQSLARAFDRAWENYCRSGRLTVSQDVARTELARRLVQLSKDGVSGEERLASAGLIHLCQLARGGQKTKP